jgi:hypothetical protein
MSEGIDYFGRGHWLTSIQERVSLSTRRRMYDLWLEVARPPKGARVLDIGTTPDRERRDSNCMIPWFHDDGLQVSLYSPEDIGTLAGAFPYATQLPSAGFGAPIPAPDQAFDWAISSAVLEHVGNADAQTAFIAECARVARGVFLTTPNRWHWLEFHTKLPLLHWMPREQHRAALRGLGRPVWASESHLRLLDLADVRRMAEKALGDAFRIELKTVWALGMPSNIVLVAWRRSG